MASLTQAIFIDFFLFGTEFAAFERVLGRARLSLKWPTVQRLRIPPEVVFVSVVRYLYKGYFHTKPDSFSCRHENLALII